MKDAIGADGFSAKIFWSLFRHGHRGGRPMKVHMSINGSVPGPVARYPLQRLPMQTGYPPRFGAISRFPFRRSDGHRPGDR